MKGLARQCKQLRRIEREMRDICLTLTEVRHTNELPYQIQRLDLLADEVNRIHGSGSGGQTQIHGSGSGNDDE